MASCQTEPLSDANEQTLEFQKVIKQAYALGYEHYGSLGLAPDEFAAHLISVTRKHTGPGFHLHAAIDFVVNLHLKDFYLAVACAQHYEAAWLLFITTYRKYIIELAHYASPNPDAARELADGVMADMFLHDRFGRSRIASYAGRSSLARWLRVVVTHRAINKRKRKGEGMQDIETLQNMADQTSTYNIEAAVRAGRYEHVIKDSFERACRILTDSERLILVLRYEDDLQINQIARLLDVHASTVSRRLEHTRQKLRDEVISIFTCKYSLSPAAIEECLTDITENPSHSILALIKQNSMVSHPPAPEHDL